METSLFNITDLIIQAIKKFFVVDEKDIIIEEIKLKKDKLKITIKAEEYEHLIEIRLIEKQENWLTIDWCSYTIYNKGVVTEYITNAYRDMVTILRVMQGFKFHVRDLLEVLK